MTLSKNADLVFQNAIFNKHWKFFHGYDFNLKMLATSVNEEYLSYMYTFTYLFYITLI